MVMEVNGDVIALLQHVFRMCDVDNQGRISVKDLLHLGQKHLGHDNQVKTQVKVDSTNPKNRLKTFHNQSIIHN